MKTVMTNPIKIMTMKTSVTVICCNQNLIAMMAVNNVIQPPSGVIESKGSKICS